MQTAYSRFFSPFCLILFLLGVLAAARPAAAKTVWTCSMHPQIQLPGPGKCPICFMDLIKVEKEEGEGKESLRQISLDERYRKLARVEVEPVSRGKASTAIRMVGKVDYDETRVGTITSWVSGRIDKLFVDYTGSHVRRGQPMAKIYSPELLTAQAELIQAQAALKRAGKSGNSIIEKSAQRTLAASREKLRLLGLDDNQLKSIEKQGKPTDHITLTAQMSGIVIKKNVNEGMYVKTGSPIYTLADLDRVWVILEAYESDLHGLRLKQQVQFSVESYPGTIFQGQVSYIDPLVNQKSRTIRVRLNVDNRDARLKPGMFVRASAADMTITDASKLPLLIPASAPLVTGKRALVYVQVPHKSGIYIGREIVLGPRVGDYYEVKSGLKEGELVVTRGNFKIDSAIQIQGHPSLMNPYQAKKAGQDAKLPSLFISQLRLLNGSFSELSRAVHNGDLQQQRAAVKSFRKALNAVSAQEVKGEARLGWNELSMLLRDDTILLGEADNQQESRQLYSEMADHFAQLRRQFALKKRDNLPLGSAELRAKIAPLVRRYLKLQQHLAADDFSAAHKDSAALVPLVNAVAADLDKTGLAQAAPLAQNLRHSFARLQNAKDLEQQRSAFYPASQALAGTVKTFGNGDATTLYLEFCPMAFNNKGAIWVSNSREIQNPYFGAKMLHCGEVRQQLTR